MNIKIALPTSGNQVDSHFGHCESFTLLNIEEGKVVNEEIVPSAQGCGCKSNIVHTLKDKGVELMLAGNMGQGAVNKLQAAEIKVIRGCQGNISTVVDAYLGGNLVDSSETCGHHGHGHSHGHQHGHGHTCNHNH